jgi:solute carrier family 25 (mitochondrial carnitine/acylcarnitine transporter), member 20/29
LDTLKVHVQSGRGSVLECTKNLLKGGTLATAYRGVTAPLGGIAVVNAIVFGTYGNARRAMPNSDSLMAHATAGTISGFLQSFALSPIELVKTRLQLAKPGEGMPSGTLAAARYILQTGGFKALYRGLGMTIARDSPALAIYFTSYEILTAGDKSATTVFLGGGVAGILSWALLYPLDVVKSRIQGDVEGRYTGAWDCFKKSIRADGWKSMTRGIGAVSLRAFICNGACFTAVAWTEQAWQHYATTGAVHPLVHVQAVGIGDSIYHEISERYFEI